MPNSDQDCAPEKKTGFKFRGNEIIVSKTRGRPITGLVKMGMERGIYPEAKKIGQQLQYAEKRGFRVALKKASRVQKQPAALRGVLVLGSGASSVVSANIDTQSSDRQAGTTPAVEISQTLGFRPTMLFKLAGTRPEPAVSVPSDSGTIPAATAAAEPELEPPGIRPGWNGLRGTP